MNKSPLNQGNMLPHKQADTALPQSMHHTAQPPKEQSSPLHGQPGPAALPTARGGPWGARQLHFPSSRALYTTE